ncbi:MAG: hypothetical protein GYA67_07435 [Smithella sp.]|jgi:hypothetical protein|nr:hypothetical protein [Syntrophaceae bacterium]NMC91482.1 hypothetical protein [Smithella sp.]HOU55500.1 hypothetical protein [Smithellaceae bacterium]HQC10075.1 hypothetical protein [Smithellaceae bacterium]HQJ77408.1 hypothetical protein [Smithellaceae bacterium]
MTDQYYVCPDLFEGSSFRQNDVSVGTETEEIAEILNGNDAPEKRRILCTKEAPLPRR